MNTQLNRMLFSRAFVKMSACVVLSAGCLPMATYAESIGLPVVETVLQQKAISGKVVDSKGESIIGANVMEKGTSNGTITDFDGNFNLNVAANAVLQISYIGYKTQEISANQLKVGTVITLKEDAEVMDEVVVIGYGTQRKGDVTSAITSIKADNFITGKITDAAELIKGKVAGLSITKSTGDPNATSSIMLRGITTITGNVSPLVLVDGIEGSLTTVAPENIASIDVLKDASAAAIYGTRGANGVIIITTKTGRRDSHAEISYNGYVSFSNWYKTADFMDANDIKEGYTSFDYEGHNTDWLKAVTRKFGITHNHSLNLNGGGKNMTYAANITYANEEGIMRKSDRENLKMQLDLTQYALKDKLKFNVNLLYARNKYTNNNNSYVYRQALIHNPSSPIYNEDGSYYEELSRYQYYNPVAIQNEQIGDTRKSFVKLVGNITMEPIKGWKTNLMLSMKEDISTSENYYTSKYYSEMTAKRNGWASKSSANGRSDNLELTSKYDFMLRDSHRISALVGYSFLYNVYDGFNAGNGNFPSEFFLYNNLVQGSYLTDKDHTASMGSYKNDNTLIGFFGRISYAFNNRYNLLVSIRREGSSKFGVNNKWGTFPSVSLGWSISNERFMKHLTWLNNLKLRAGYGVTGVIPGASYLSLTTFTYDVNGKYLNKEGAWLPSLKVSQNPNPSLRWEKTKEINIGLDWAMLDNRLSGSIDVYSKKTIDLLYDYAVPLPPNMYDTTKANVGQMRNNGIEIMINAIPIKSRNFEWSTTATLAHNNNKLLSLSNELYETDNFKELYGGISDPISLPTHCMEVGHRLGTYWGLKSVGVSKNGIVLVEVSDGNGGWIVKEYDRKYDIQSNRQRLGNGLPKLYLGWSHNFRYRNFDLSMQFTGQFGYKILNAQRCFYENNSIAYNKLKSASKYYGAIDESGNPVIDSETGEQLQVQLSNVMMQGFWSDHLENGNFVKLSSATLGYNVPLSSAMKKYLSSLRLYVSGQNLFCITKYSGLDPEVSNSFLTPGVDNRDKYPTTRSFTFGLNVNF
jgi:TonB-linked SusC/RagA family outer membrane protein